MNDIANHIGIAHRSLYSRLKSPKLTTLIQIADFLNVDVIELIEPTSDYAHFYSDGEWLGVRKK
ncbi:helix-turn-helix transcriptional regulator [Aquimarina algiphila]|uniref:Helix-turn-helix transcriptional regulator n=2 Tax=Aquimarina algiphila TaxID=2047982 RepID=A0A554VE66_9FLAO|nr:helix-turn-helix transcriptional regulator [Aquimarina algiphila]